MVISKSKTVVHGRYMNLSGDWGFKYIFYREEHKKYLIHFLNEILQGKEKITDITYLPTEQLGKTENDRKAIFDAYCTNEKGEHFIIEMQNMPQIHFRDRSLFYSTFPIRNQAIKGEWNYELKAVYIIAILNFELFQEEVDDAEYYIEQVYLTRARTGKIFSDKLNFLFIELPKFKKKVEELENNQDCWFFLLKNLRELEAQPPEIQGEIFDEIFKDVELTTLTPKEMESYTIGEFKYENFRNYADYAEMKGMEKSKYQITKKLLAMGMPVRDIAIVTGLTPKQIRQTN